jgi:hypothetical protein
MKVLALSAPQREDVQDMYRYFHNYYWPDCNWELEFLDGPTDPGWTRRLLIWLRKHREDPYLMINLDDYVYSKLVDEYWVNVAFNALKDFPNIGCIQLYKVKEPEYISGQLPCFGQFSKDGALEKRSQVLPSLYRRDFLIAMCENVLTRITPEQDRAWVGAYNFELYGGAPSCTLDVLTPLAGHDNAPIQIVNAIEQGKWTEAGVQLARREGYPIAPAARGIHHAGDNPYMDAWNRARP